MITGAALGRRTFLGLAAAAGAAVTLPSLVGSASAAPLRYAAFRGLIGQRLAVRGGGSVRVLEVVDNRRAGESGEAFTVILGPTGVAPEASLLTVTHRALGTVVLGATAVGRSGRLQAVVDLRRPPHHAQES